MIFGDSQKRPAHWVKAVGASVAVHAGAAFLLADLAGGLGSLDSDLPQEPAIMIASVILKAEDARAEQVASTQAPVVTPTEDQTAAADPEPAPVTAMPDPAPEPVEAADADTGDAGATEPVVPTETPAPSEPNVEAAELQPAPQIPPAPSDLIEPISEDPAPATPPVALAPQTASPQTPLDGVVIAAAPTPMVVAPTTQTTTSPATALDLAEPITTPNLPPFQPLSQPSASSSVPPSPDRTIPPTPSPELVLRERIAARRPDPCLLAIPLLEQSGATELVLMGANDRRMRSFSDAVLRDLVPTPSSRNVLADGRQCAALNFVREGAAYPAFDLTINLDQTTIEDKSYLTGTIDNAGGRYLSLLLIDDNGVVQDLGDYLSFSSAETRFSIPMTRAETGRDTSHALLALATDRRPEALTTQNGQLAVNFFRELRAELGAEMPMALMPFDIR